MKKITLNEQLRGYLYQAERKVVEEVMGRVASDVDRELIELGLLTYAKYKDKINFRTDDPYAAIIVEGLKPYIDMSAKKAADRNYNLTMICDLPD